MNKFELRDRVYHIERHLARAMDFANKMGFLAKHDKDYDRMYDWLTSAYRMTDSLKIIIDNEKD